MRAAFLTGFLLLAGSCLGSPLLVVMVGEVHRVKDTLGWADSLGIKVGMPVRYEMVLDYEAQPAQGWNDTVLEDGTRIDVFKFNFLGRRYAPVTPPVFWMSESGQFRIYPQGKTEFALINTVLGKEVGEHSQIILACDAPSGRLETSTACQAGETLSRNHAASMEYGAVIKSISISGEVAVRGGGSPRGGYRRPARQAHSAFRFLGGSYFLNGKASP